MFRVFSSIIGLLILAVALPKLGEFLTAHGWPVQAAMDLAQQGVAFFVRELKVLFASA